MVSVSSGQRRLLRTRAFVYHQHAARIPASGREPPPQRNNARAKRSEMMPACQPDCQTPPAFSASSANALKELHHRRPWMKVKGHHLPQRKKRSCPSDRAAGPRTHARARPTRRTAARRWLGWYGTYTQYSRRPQYSNTSRNTQPRQRQYSCPKPYPNNTQYSAPPLYANTLRNTQDPSAPAREALCAYSWSAPGRRPGRPARLQLFDFEYDQPRYFSFGV